MGLQSYLFLIPYGLAFLVSLAAALYAWRRRDIRGAGTYGWVVIGQASYIFGYMLEHLYTDLNAKILWNDIQLIASVIWISAFMLFALHYTNRKLPRVKLHLYLFFTPALIYIILVMLASKTPLIRQNITLIQEFDTVNLSYTPGIAIWLWTAYACGIGGIGFNAISDRYIHTPKVYRIPIRAVLFGNMLPMVSALLTMIDIRLAGRHDATPLVILVGQLVVIWGLSRYRLHEIVPVAWHTVIKQMNDPVFILDPVLNVVDMNPAAEQTTNTHLPEVRGSNISQIITVWEIPETQFDPNGDTELELPLDTDTDRQFYRLQITPLRSNRDYHSGYALVAHNITRLKNEQQELRNQSEILESLVDARTIELQAAVETADVLNRELKQENEERRKVEKSLRISQDRYELATAVGKIAVWEWDMAPDLLYVSSMLQSWLQTSEQDIGLRSDDWLDLIHPEDREYVESNILKYAHGKIPELLLQHRVLLPSGEVLWFDMHAVVIFDENAKPVRIIGTNTDITESVAMLDSLRKRDIALEAVNYVAEQLLRSTDWKQECDLLLAQLGEALQVDRALIIRMTQDAQGVFTADLANEWHTHGIPSMMNQAQFHNADTSGYQRWYDLWQQGKPFFAHIRDLPEDETRFERAMGIKTTLQMPVMINGHLWGTISFHHVAKEREWSSAEMEALSTVVSMLGTAIERQNAREAQQRYAERLRILQEIDRAILAEESPPNIANAALTHIRDLVPCERASVAIYNEELDEMQVLATDTAGHTSVGPNMTASLSGMWKAFPELFEGQVYHITRREFEAAGKQYPVMTMLISEGIEAVALIPLVLQGKVVGSLNFGAKQDDFYETLDLDAVLEIADQLAIALQQAWLFEQITAHAEELETRVRERTIELESLNEELKRLSTLKDEFVSNVSHELRTPIASLGLYHDLLIRRPDKLNTYVDALKRETNRLFNLVEDLLYLSRMDQGQVSTNLKCNDVNDLVAEYVYDRTPLAEGKNLQLILNQEADLPEVMMDRSMLGQVISIVMTNAFNYTPGGGSIKVTTQQAWIECRQWAGFSISDTGPGIPKEEREQLFSRFFRGNVAVETQVAGTGLGLAIAKEIIDRHQGRIEVESEGIPSLGTTFTIWLPVAE